jgi:deazaflavin-dependent oxidoreductase (nitroreductase family)
MAILSTPPAGVSRALFAAPLWLYRLNLGWLLGHRLARVTHRGRRSGRIYQTVIEVLRYDRRTRAVVVASGWGGRTDWYRNILEAPALEIRIGRVSYSPAQRFLSAEELYTEVRTYQRRHRWVARWLFPRLLGVPADAPDSELRARIVATLRGVEFRPVD